MKLAKGYKISEEQGTTFMNDDSFVRRLQRRIDNDPELTPAGLAVLSGIDNSTIRKMLSGVNQSPKIATAEKICAALGTTFDSFMSDSQDPVLDEILSLYRQLRPKERRLLAVVARGLVSHLDEDA